MPRIPTYQPGQVGPVQTTQARFRAPDMAGSGLGAGMQNLGQALGQFAEVQDHLVAQSEDTQARAAALEARAKVNDALTQFSALTGGNAVAAQAATHEKLKAIKDGTTASLTTPRMKQFFDQRFGESYADAVSQIDGHALQQSNIQHKGVLLAEQSEAMDIVSTPGLYKQPDKFNEAIGHVRDRASEYATFSGLGEAAGTYIKEQVGGAYESAIHQAIVAQDVDFASDIFNAHHDEMTADQKSRAFTALQKPIQDREYDSIFVAATTGKPITEQAPGKGSAFQSPVAASGPIKHGFGEARGGGKSHNGVDIPAAMGAAIHPIAGGTVIPLQASSDSGNYVAVRHPDGTVSTYSHMGNVSVKVGDQVNADTVLGTVGMTGHTTGPHVHLVTRDAEGNLVDPQKVIGKGTRVAGAPDTARNYDQATVISNIKAMGLPPEKERGAIDHALGRMRQSESVLADQQSDLGQRVHDWVGNYQSQHGGEYPPPEALPSWASNWQGAPELRGSLAGAQKAKHDKAAADAQNWAWLNATLRMYNDPEGFLKADVPKEYLGKVSAGDYAQIVTAQARMRQDASKPQAWNPYQDSKQALDTYLLLNPPSTGKLQDSQRAAALQTIKDVATEFVTRTGKPPTDSDMQDIARRSMRKVNVPGALWGTNEVSLYNVASVPKEAHDRIAGKFKQTFKRDPTDQEVVQWYRRDLAGEPQ